MRWQQRSCASFWVLACVFLACGCASQQAQKDYDAYAQRLSDQVGKAHYDDYVSEWGPPSAKEPVSTGFVARWHRSYGYANEASITFGRNPPPPAPPHEVYDDFVLTFDGDGILRRWRVRVQR